MVTSAATHRSDIELCLLGPLNVVVDGEQVSVGGPRQMAVLARLMLTPDQVVTMDQLVDSVWDGDEPSQPHVAVRSYISNLRRAIEPNRRRRASDSCLASSPPGYRLTIDPAAVDWVRFQRLVEGSRSSLASGDAASAVPQLRLALSLWRGEPCSGLSDSDVFRANRARLRTLRQTAIELLYESLLIRGDHSAVASEVEAAIADDPLRERLTELGMLAFYRSGRQSEALALGRRLRARLVDELGIDPSPAIEEMELKILNHDRSLDPEPPVVSPVHPRPGQSGSALDPDQVHRLEPSGNGTVPEPVDRPAGERHVTDVMVASTLTVGRDHELATLSSMAEALAAGRSMAAAVTGEQGIGKTTLVRALADRLADEKVSVLWAHTVAGELSPMWPWAKVVLDLLEPEDEVARAGLLAGLGALAELSPSVAAALAEHGSVEKLPTTEVMLATTRLLERRARRDPIVVVLEDLQWADPATVTMLKYAASTLIDSPVGFVMTWRETDVAPGPLATALREVSRLPTLVRVDLEGLEGGAALEMGRRLGGGLSRHETMSIHRRCHGNPLYIREMLGYAAGDRTGSSGPSILQDAVVDRVERLDNDALPVLRAAALFRTPFAAGDLEPLASSGLEAMERVVAAALRGGLLEEVDPVLGTHRFRHAVVGEVLAAGMVAVERWAMHRSIGQHLLHSGDHLQASYHLARSPEPADRALSARLALDAFHRGVRTLHLAELDHRIRGGLTAIEALRRVADGPFNEDLVTDALGFLSWRARVDDRPTDWLDNARRNLGSAMEGLSNQPEPRGGGAAMATVTTPLRGRGPGRVREQPLDRLQRSVLNMIGLPTIPAGAGDPSDFVVTGGQALEELAAAVERLPTDRPARWAGQVHLAAVNGMSRSGVTAGARTVRDTQKVVSTARRRLDGEGMVPVLGTLLARCSDLLDPATVDATLRELAELQSGPALDLACARYGHPALLALGRTDEAGRMVEDALAGAEAGGDDLQRAEARLLWTRHVLWTGQLEAAAHSIDLSADDWSVLGLPEPLPLLRQRRALRLLAGQPAALADVEVGRPGMAPAGHDAVVPERAGPAAVAFRLARSDRPDQAAEHIDAMASVVGRRHIPLAELALLGGAAALIGHRKAAAGFQKALVDAGDRLVVRSDGSVILGPAGLWAALAAFGAGRRAEAGRLARAALDETRRTGGSARSFETVAELVGLPLSNRPPTQP